MALGKLEKVDNADRTFGSSTWYWRVGVQLAGTVEYWLVTESEATQFAERGARDTENSEGDKSGKVGHVVNKDPAPGSAPTYYELAVTLEDEILVFWSLTEGDLARVRKRVSKNPEDVVTVAKQSLLSRFWTWFQAWLE